MDTNSHTTTLTPVIEIANLTKTYQMGETQVHALRGVSLTIAEGGYVEISIDALVGQTFQGVVDQIAPINAGTDGVINYPVTIRLIDPMHEDAHENDRGDVRSGMTAVATLVSSDTVSSDLWLIPADAVQTDANPATITVVRDESTLTIEVQLLEIRNDWRMVQSTELQIGDQVRGTVASYVDEGDIFGQQPENAE